MAKPVIDLQPDYDTSAPNRNEKVSKSFGYGVCSAEEAANMIGVSKSTVYKLIRSGQMYATKKRN